MKESYMKILAKYHDPKSCVINRKVDGEALTGAQVGRVLSSEIKVNQGADVVDVTETNTKIGVMASLSLTLRSRRPLACLDTLYTRTGRPNYSPLMVKRSAA